MDARGLALHQPTGSTEALTLYIHPRSREALRKLVASKNRLEAKDGHSAWLTYTLRLDHGPVSDRQYKLYYRFVTALADDQGLPKDDMDVQLKRLFLGEEERTTTQLQEYAGPDGQTLRRFLAVVEKAPRSKRDLDAVEMARFTEQVIQLCAEQGLDVYTEWCEWCEIREKLLEAAKRYQVYQSIEALKAARPFCEACGTGLIRADESGRDRHTGQAAHIKSRGAGASAKDPDAVWILCPEDHQRWDNGVGRAAFLELYPHLRSRAERVLRKGTGSHGTGDKCDSGASQDGAAGAEGSGGATVVAREDTEAVRDGDTEADEAGGDAGGAHQHGSAGGADPVSGSAEGGGESGDGSGLFSPAEVEKMKGWKGWDGGEGKDGQRGK